MISRLRPLVALVLGLSCVTAMAAVPKVPEKIRQLLQERQYEQAVKAIDSAANDSGADQDYLAYLRGRALYLQNQFDQAVEAFNAAEKKYPKSQWVRRYKFGKALALARKGDFRAAEQIYAGEAQSLLSIDRKHELADIYLEFADKYFKPRERDKQPDYQKALDFFTKALELGPKPEIRVQVELWVAQCYQQLGNHQQAATLYEKFIKEHDKNPLAIEARFLLGQAQLALSRPADARRTWQDLLALHVDSKSDRVAEAAYHIALTYGLPQPGSDEDLTLGVAALESFVERFSEHALASQAHLVIAQSYVHRGRLADAVTSLTRFLKNPKYAPRKEVPDAQNLLGRAYQLQKKYDEALSSWQDFLKKFPTHAAWSDVQRAIIDTEYLMAGEKRERKQYDEALKLWSEFLAKYPLEPRAPAILLEFGQMKFEQEKWDAAIDSWRQLVSKYPGTNEASRAQFMIGLTLEEKQTKLAEALEEYRKLTWGDHASQAAAKVSALTTESLSISTPRVFRSDETPKIKLVTRNLEAVDVRAYSVDLETYFRKMHLGSGVESLDIALIDPDKSFEFSVPKFEKYQQLENEVEIPLPGDGKAGVVAVTVSSKTLETTTLVVQSDLDLIIKSSRDEVFVYAQNMRTGKPWANAKLLISNGKQVFTEATTGKDGVLQKSFEELKEADDLRVFAIADNHVSSSVIGLQGLGVSKGVSEKGYIYTERSAYRAGQMVHLRGIIRRVTGDSYSVDKSKKYLVEVFDPRSRLVREDKVSLNDFGSFHTHFILAPSSPPGDYRIVVRTDDDKQNYQGGFRVHEYQLEPVRLAVDSSRKVYYRGEEITGTIVASYYYGAPLANREIQYQLAGDRVYTAKTDAEGKIPFKLPTREFRESQVLPLSVTLPERNLRLVSNFFLATQGFSIEPTVTRDVFLENESFDVTVRVKDAEGKPLAEKLNLALFEQTTVDGKVGERLVEQHAIKADKDGVARQSLVVEKGGAYFVRVTGTDRFKNNVAAQRNVQISDENDDTRLRLLVDEHHYKAGDQPEILVHWREAPALALITNQGAKILDYRLVELKTGVNHLRVPMFAKLAPNFDLSVAVMTDRRAEDADAKNNKPRLRFHTAISSFTVDRGLKVKLDVARAAGEGTVRPGEAVRVKITTTDPQGMPLAAEVSLAMIEQAFLEQFAANVPAMDDFFRGALRTSAVRTNSTILFSYSPTTQSINQRLLAERDRREIEGEERIILGVPVEVAASAAPMPAMDAADGAVLVDSLDADGPADSKSFFGQSAGAGFGAVSGKAGGLAGRNKRPAKPSAKFSELSKDTTYSLSTSGEGKPGLRTANGTEGGSPQFAQTEGLALSNAQPVNGRYDTQVDFAYRAPTVKDVQRFIDNKQREFSVLNANGEFACVNLDRRSGDDSTKLAKQLAASGAILLPLVPSQETGYWNPSIVTDDKGVAQIEFDLPDRSTAWKLTAKGITTETLAGEAETDLVAKKQLFGELKLPLAFTDGDQAEIGVTVHNDLIDQGKIEVVLEWTIAGKKVSERKTIDVKSKGIEEVAFKATFARPERKEDDAEKAVVKAQGSAEAESIAFELTVSAGKEQELSRKAVPLVPYGMNVYATASGAASSDTTAWVEAPADMPLSDQRLQILLGPSVERSLLDVVLGSPPTCQLDVARMASTLDVAVSDLMASLALQKFFAGSRQADNPQATALDARVRSALGLLVSSQNDDGSWNWSGVGGGGNRYITARVVWALSLAKTAGYTSARDAAEKANAYLQSQIAATSDTDYESKAILLHALSTVGHGDFALANRLYRERPSLSNAALAYLALAFAEMDRTPVAGELLDLLASRDLDKPESRREKTTGSLPWSHAPAELHSLYALALEKVEPTNGKVKEQVDWLLSHRVGHRWSPDKATGPATLALAQWFAENRFQAEHYRLTLFVNDLQAAVLDIDDEQTSRTIDIPARMLKAGKQRINFQLTGRGRFSYQAILAGFVPADKVKSTTQSWRLERNYEPAPLELDGQEIPRGFAGLQGSYSTFRNPLSQLPVGKRALVDLTVWRNNVSPNTPPEQLEYLVITEPLPSGATPIEQSIRGGFERYEITPGAITFYVGTRQYVEPIHYELHGYLPGDYKAAGSLVRDAYRPDQIAVAQPKTLKILPLGEKNADAYRLTPQELFELGKRKFDKHELAKSGEHLTELIEKWNLAPEVYKEAARLLLDVHLELGPPAKVVHYFEIIKEKWPDLEIGYDKILKVGAAYHEMGEYERSYLIFRATIESSFQRESGVAGFLEAQGEFLRSVEVMQRLLAEYPSEPYVAAATYALAGRVYAKSPEAAADPKLREKKINRVTLVRDALSMLEDFLTGYPEDPAADQAAFSIAGGLVELRNFKQAIDAGNRFAERYPNSEYLDSFWYIIGYSHFALGEHEKALEMCRKVAEATVVDKTTGKENPSANKWRAIYILGQIYHSLGQAAEAIEQYSRVKSQFSDAAQAIEYFTRKAISLPEVTSVEPGKPAQLEITFRNIANCDVKVYRIDLMKFSLLQRSLGGITKINLAGIRPQYDEAIKLGDGKDYRDRKRTLELPLKEEGAYLVVCRGDDLHASGLVLVTPLKVEVQEEASSGRVRTTVKDVASDSYAPNVHVKVIGTRNSDFIPGYTDLRGVFVADGIQGTSTVIAQAEGGRYAFFRGQTELGPPPATPAAAAGQQQNASPGASESDEKDSLLKGVIEGNRKLNEQQQQQLKQLYERPNSGVKAHDAF